MQGAKETHSKDSLKIQSLEGKLAQLTANSKKMEKKWVTGLDLVREGLCGRTDQQDKEIQSS